MRESLEFLGRLQRNNVFLARIRLLQYRRITLSKFITARQYIIDIIIKHIPSRENAEGWFKIFKSKL